MTPLDVYYCGGSQVAGMGLPVTQALPVQVTRALRERWGRDLGHSYVLEYSGDPGDLERTLRKRRIPRPFIIVLVPRNVYVWGVPQLADVRRRFRGAASLDAAVMDDVVGYMAGVAAAPVPPTGPARSAWLAGRSAVKVLWYAAWLPTLPWWVLRYERALRSLQRFARQVGCRLFVLATPVPLRAGTSRLPSLSWYLALLAWYLRSKAGGDVIVADLFSRLSGPSPEPLQFYHDRMVHLTTLGTRLAASVIVQAATEGAARRGLLTGSD